MSVTNKHTPSYLRLIVGTLVWMAVFVIVVIECDNNTVVAPADNVVAEDAVVAAAAAAETRPPRLFDFQLYKRTFHKAYAGLLEELARQKCFLARAFRAFVSGVKYKYRDSPFYLALNDLSDHFPGELAKMRNRVLEREHPRGRLQSYASERPPETRDALRNEVEMRVDESNLRELEQVLDEPHPTAPREFPLDKLINTGAEAELSEEARAKLAAPADQDAPAPLQLAQVMWFETEPPTPPTQQEIVNETMAEPSAGASEAQPDELFVDLRRTNCFLLPRKQGLCGSCYAFTTIAIMEWIHCMKTGRLVAFSEQYLIDCGRGRVPGVEGCEGGNQFGGAAFVRNFGLELRSEYPYRERQGSCPYDVDRQHRSMGHVRAHIESALTVSERLFHEYLPFGPLYLKISLAPGFHEYGGGVHGHGCSQTDSEHAVVLVGHGREDGREYWLIRNSHSVGWGEGGYYKLAKDAGCIPFKEGYMYATNDGRQLQLAPEPNELNDKSLLRQHYAANILAPV